MRKLRLLRHHLIAHPVAGLCWFVGLEKWGDWVHDHL
jgi:hypothetical protein